MAQATPAPAASPTDKPPEKAVPPPERPEEPKVKDGFRLRGGFSINGGFVTLPGAEVSGFSFGLGARLGAQINHLFGVYYQNTPMVLLIGGDDGVAAGFVDYNSVLANLTLLHMIDIGAGPSVDYAAVAGCSSELACGAGSSVNFGLHGRFALNIGGLSGQGPRRSGFSLGADIHPVFMSGSTLLSMTAGIGGEWY